MDSADFASACLVGCRRRRRCELVDCSSDGRDTVDRVHMWCQEDDVLALLDGGVIARVVKVGEEDLSYLFF